MSSSDDDAPLARPNGRASTGSVMVIDSANLNGAKRKARTSLQKPSYRDESDSDGQPLAKRQKPAKVIDPDSDDEPISQTKPQNIASRPVVGDSSDDDEPLGAKLARSKPSKPIPKKVIQNDSEDDSDDDLPIAKTLPPKRLSNGVTNKKSSSSLRKADAKADSPVTKNGKVKGVTVIKKVPVKDNKKTSRSEDPEDVEEEYEWWNAQKPDDDTIKWQSLEHNGVLLAPPYEPLPKNIKMLYEGKPITLSNEAEEVAIFWVSMMGDSATHHLNNPVFRKNFMDDFSDYVKKCGATDKEGNRVLIKDLDKCDFSKMRAYWVEKTEAAKNKNLTKQDKEKAKAAKDLIEAPFLHCFWDGRKQKVGNFRVEPPSLFRGRGEHPKTGRVKRRVLPEQITINIGKSSNVPEPPPGHKWKEVRHDQTATWLAMWQENINGAKKYVMLGAASDIKGQSDFKKFGKARELKKHIARIRKDYQKQLKSQIMADRQRATAMYLIDKLALRAGNEKDTENEADTVGCCSLKYEHITLKPPNIVEFDFLGKDSIPYRESKEVDEQVFKNLKVFKREPKREGDDLFDRLTTSQLNKHLNGYMPGLTAKVFRTFNASYTMSTLLNKLGDDPRSRGTIAEKIKLYNDCNREVAILCNHKRTVTAAHETGMQKLNDQNKALRYQKWRLKQMILDIDPSQKKKKKPVWFKLDEDIDKEWIKQHHVAVVEEIRKKTEKKFEKENEKLKAEKQKPMLKEELKERLKAVKELEVKQKQELKTGKVEVEGRGMTVEKLVANIEKLDERVRQNELKAEDRDGNKEVALGTSKLNYIDPRLTVVFAKKFDVPIEKLFPKTMRDKFNWAIKSVQEADDWEF